MKYFVLEKNYDTSVPISRLNMNCHCLFNRLVVVVSDTTDEHWQKPVVSRRIQEDVYEPQLIKLLVYIYIYIYIYM